MNPRAYYSDNNPVACAVMRELILEGLIPEGDVDGRSITEVQASDLVGYTQIHLFAGYGGWPLAIRLAGWPDDRPVLSGSCPCPPFSSAGKKKWCPRCQSRVLIPNPIRTGIFVCCECGHEWLADGRHLWPEMFRLIREIKPANIVGEQVGGSDGVVWLTGVRSCLEAIGYDVGALDIPACGQGEEVPILLLGEDGLRETRVLASTPNIRQRLFWSAVRVADMPQQGDGRGRICGPEKGDCSVSGQAQEQRPERCGSFGGLQHSQGDERDERGTESNGRGSPCGCCLRDDGGYGTPSSRDWKDSGPAFEADPSIVAEADPVAAPGLLDDRLPDARCECGWKDESGERTEGGTVDRGDCSWNVHSGISNSSNVGRQFEPNECGSNAERNRATEFGSESGPNILYGSPWSNFDVVICRDTDKRGVRKARRIPRQVKSGVLKCVNGVPYVFPSGSTQSDSEIQCGEEGDEEIQGGVSTFPLASKEAWKGTRVGLLKLAGNAINPCVGAEFVRCFMESAEEASKSS